MMGYNVFKTHWGVDSGSHQQNSDSCIKKKIWIHFWLKMVFVIRPTHMCEQHKYVSMHSTPWRPNWVMYTQDWLSFFFLCFLRLQYSLCNEPLIELSNPGASGSVFYVTKDDEFIIKTVMHKEAEFLQKLLPGYYMVSLCAMWVLDA